MYVGLKQPRGDGERYVTPARAAAKETRFSLSRLVDTQNWLQFEQQIATLRLLFFSVKIRQQMSVKRWLVFKPC